MLLDDLAAKLVADGVIGVGSLFLSSGSAVPTGPGPFLSLNEVGGTQPTRIQNDPAPATKRPTVQVLARAGNFGSSFGAVVARALADAAYDSLDGIFNTNLSGVRYLRIVAKQEPTDMGMDGTGARIQFVFNLEIEKYPS